MVASIVRTTCGSGWSSNYAISFAKINRPLPQAVLTKSRTTRITGGVAKFFFDAQELIVFRNPI